MSNELYYRISDLPDAVAITGAEIVEAIQDGVNVKFTLEQLMVTGRSAYDDAVLNGFSGSVEAWLLTLEGANGKSVYDLAVEDGFEGSLSDFLVTLKGVDGDQGEQGPAGKSAYDSAVEAGFEGTEAQWVESLALSMDSTKLQELLNEKGYTVKDVLRVLGVNGGLISNSVYSNFAFLFDKRVANTNIGSSAKIPQRAAERGRMEAEGYSYWKNSPATTNDPAGKLPETPDSEVRLFDDGRFQIGSMTDYVEFGNASTITIVNGEDSQSYNLNELAKSAYEVAVDEGFEGDVSQWLASLQGVDGKSALEVIQEQFPEVVDAAALVAMLKGEKGDTGETGRAMRIAGIFDTVEELPDPVDAELAAEAYYVAKHIYVPIDGEWVDVGDMMGPPGIGLYIRGSLGSIGQLPTESNQNGDTYIINRTMYTFDGQAWVPVGAEGPAGKSAYQAAVDAGFEGSNLVWLESLKGEKGDDGDKGDKGEQGEKGDDAYALRIIDELDPDATLPITAPLGDAYLLNGHLYGMTVSGWKDLGIFHGKSNYDLALENGYEGTLGQWLATLNGTNGTNGLSAYQLALAAGFVGTIEAYLASLHGTDGQGLQIDGAVGTVGELPAPPTVGDDAVMWLVGLNLYFGKDDAWTDLGLLKGADGTNGTNGLSALEVLKLSYPEVTDAISMAAFLKGAPGNDGVGFAGPAGPTGPALRFRGVFVDLIALNNLSNKQLGDIAAIGRFYYHYDGVEWIEGVEAIGANGTNGTNGTDGTGIIVKGILANAGELPVEDAVRGDAYLIDGDVWFMGATAFFNAGQLRGTDGIDGTNGTNGIDAYALAVSLGYEGSAQEWIDDITGVNGLSAYDIALEFDPEIGDEAAWLASLVGPAGPAGPMGPGVKILGELANTSLLPSGAGLEIGDGYLISGHFHGWTGSAWVDCGSIQGPQGEEGEQGPAGPRGIKGEQGPRGSSLILLDHNPGILDGAVNDTCVNTITQGVYLKTNVTTWTFIGNFGGGNVYSPNDDGFTYVRKGGAWERFNRYDLTAVVSTGACDLTESNVFKIVNTTAGAKTVSLLGADPDRITTVVLLITGNTGTVNWPGNVVWNDSTPPDLGATLTNVVFLWDGVRFIGSVGAKV